MSASRAAGAFVSVNPEWSYVVQTPHKPICFDPQPDGLWLAYSDTKELRLMTAPVAIKMLNEALDAGYPVIATEHASGYKLEFAPVVEQVPA